MRGEAKAQTFPGRERPGCLVGKPAEAGWAYRNRFRMPRAVYGPFLGQAGRSRPAARRLVVQSGLHIQAPRPDERSLHTIRL